MRNIIKLFASQNGSTSKTGLLYGAMIALLFVSVVIVGVILIIWAARGELDPDTAREFISQLDRPAGGAAGSSVLYNLERIAKGALTQAPGDDAQAEKTDPEGDDIAKEEAKEDNDIAASSELDRDDA